MSSFPAVPLLAIPMAFVGLIAGLLYFHALRLTVESIVVGRSWSRSAVFTFARMVCVVVGAILAARIGAAALLAAFAGFLLARTIALRAPQRAA